MSEAAFIKRLADHVERFDCRVYPDKRLMVFTGPLSWVIQQQGKHIGMVSASYTDWKIASLTDDAPDYLKALVGQSFNTAVLLQNAVRRAAFVNKLRQVLKDLPGCLSE